VSWWPVSCSSLRVEPLRDPFPKRPPRARYPPWLRVGSLGSRPAPLCPRSAQTRLHTVKSRSMATPRTSGRRSMRGLPTNPGLSSWASTGSATAGSRSGSRAQTLPRCRRTSPAGGPARGSWWSRCPGPPRNLRLCGPRSTPPCGGPVFEPVGRECHRTAVSSRSTSGSSLLRRRPCSPISPVSRCASTVSRHRKLPRRTRTSRRPETGGASSGRG